MTPEASASASAARESQSSIAADSVTGVLLVGGASRRFGSPKALARLGGETLAERAWRALAWCDERLAVGKADELDLPFRVVDDGTAERAPIFGVRVALREARHELCLFLPVDVPLLTEEALRMLVRERAVPQTGSLPGAYERSAAPGGRGPDRSRRLLPARTQLTRRRARRATAREREHDGGPRADRAALGCPDGVGRRRPPLARPPSGPRCRPARPRARGAVGRHRGARSAHAPCRPRRPLDLPLLRRRLRAARLRRGRCGDPDRGRPGKPDLARPALPEGRGDQEPRHEPAPEDRVKYRRPYATEWEELDLDTAMDLIADRIVATRAATWEESWRDAEGRESRPAARSGSGRSAARRSTTRRTTSSRSCSRPWAQFRSRTRPAYDTAPPSPVWGRRSDEAARPPTRRISPTRTAS